MKFCTECGNKLNSKDYFCTNCGKKIKEKMDFNNIVLFFGVLLIIISSFALGISRWSKMNDIFKLCFIFIEFILFNVISFAFKKMNNENVSKTFRFISIFFMPIFLVLLSYYELIGTMFSKGGNLVNVYLAIIYLLTSIIFFLEYKFDKLKLSYLISILFYVISSTFLIKKYCELAYSILISLFLSIFILICIYKVSKDQILKKSSLFIYKFIITFTSFISYFILLNSNLYEKIIILILYFSLSVYICFLDKKTFTKYLLPFAMPVISLTLIFDVFISLNVVIYIFSLLLMILYFLVLLLNDEYLKITTYVVNLFTLFIIYININNFTNITILILSIVYTLFFNLTYLITKDKSSLYITPFTIYIIIYKFTLIINLPLKDFSLVIVSLIYSLIYIFLKYKKNSFNKMYLYSSYVLLIIESFILIYSYKFSIWYVLTSVVWIYYFINSIIIEKNKVLSFLIYLFTLIILVNLLYVCEFNINYIWLIIANITLFISVLLNKILKYDMKYYMYFGIIIVFLNLFNELSNKSIMYVCLSVIGYLLSYTYLKNSSLKYKNIYLTLFMILGLNFVYNIIKIIIVPIVISSLLAIIFDFVILVILYLLDINDSKKTTIVSLTSLIPYYTLINDINIVISNELIYLPFIIYTFVLSEIIKFKSEKTKGYFILFSLLTISSISYRYDISAIIYNIVLSVIYIFIAYYKKYRILVYFAFGYLGLNIFLSLYSIFNNIILIFSLLLIGFILVIFVIINEIKKNK